MNAAIVNNVNLMRDSNADANGSAPDGNNSIYY